ncbi:MAG: sulfite exporter TauE/SafE family protein [Microbacterium sp.]
MQDDQAITREPRAYLGFVLIGLTAGLLSGLFGVGGGTVILPLLVLLLKYDQRRAAGTSLAAIVPTALVGVVSYAMSGAVAWIAALILAAGAVFGAQIGTRLMPRISQTALRWGFVAFIGIVIVSLFVVVPSRDADFVLGWVNGVGLLLVGVAIGVIAGLIGVGGGVIVVPVLMLVFGTSDLVAKGTSLMMMIPTAISGSIGNLRHGNVDLLGSAIIGISACTMTALGAWLATLIDPALGNMLFAAYAFAIGVQMAVKAVRGTSRG